MRIVLLTLLSLLLSSIFQPSTANYSKPHKTIGSYTETGMASWYGPGFHGRTTASGVRYNMNGMTAAHKTLPLNSKVKVTNLHNGKSIIVTINDRGPYIKGRIIDLSKKSASLLGVIEHGVARVSVEPLPKEDLAQR